MKKKIYLDVQPSDLEDLYAHYCFESENGIIILDKRDVNSVAFHSTQLLSFRFTREGVNAFNDIFEFLPSVLARENVYAANKVLMKIVSKGGLSFGSDEKHQLETVIEGFKPNILFKVGINEIKLGDKEVIISILASVDI